ncbi:hypothetical protein GQX74_000250 [Glossina fuscipes]|nr:hypothetical protein GQX74_000250 [Glossina fuscipes]
MVCAFRINTYYILGLSGGFDQTNFTLNELAFEIKSPANSPISMIKFKLLTLLGSKSRQKASLSSKRPMLADSRKICVELIALKLFFSKKDSWSDCEDEVFERAESLLKACRIELGLMPP